WLGYVGVAGLVLAGLGLVGGHRRAEAALLGAVVLGALLLALGQFGPLYPVLYSFVPGLGLFRVPARWLFVASFGLALLAAIGVDQLERARVRRAPSEVAGDRVLPTRALLRLVALLALVVLPTALYALVGR